MSEHVAGVCGRCPWCCGLPGIEPHVELKALQTKIGQMVLETIFISALGKAVTWNPEAHGVVRLLSIFA